jgi:hypothetical protein
MSVSCKCSLLSESGFCDGHALVQRNLTGFVRAVGCDLVWQPPSTAAVSREKQSILRKKERKI